jgi:hypothetical protein
LTIQPKIYGNTNRETMAATCANSSGYTAYTTYIADSSISDLDEYIVPSHLATMKTLLDSFITFGRTSTHGKL